TGLAVFFFQAEDGIRVGHVTGVQTCALPIFFARIVSLDDVPIAGGFVVGGEPEQRRGSRLHVGSHEGLDRATAMHRSKLPLTARSEERRVGKECRCRWSP